MNPGKRFFERVAVFSAAVGAAIVALAVVSLATGFLGSRNIGIVLLIGGLCALEGGRTSWKVRNRLPDVPQAVNPDARARNMRRTSRLLVVMWLASLGIGYATLGVFGVIFVGLFTGISFLISYRLAERLVAKRDS